MSNFYLNAMLRKCYVLFKLTEKLSEVCINYALLTLLYMLC